MIISNPVDKKRLIKDVCNLKHPEIKNWKEEDRYGKE